MGGGFEGECVCVLMDCNPPVSPSTEFFRQEYWSGLPFPTPGDPPNPGIEPTPFAFPALAGRFFTTGILTIWEAWIHVYVWLSPFAVRLKLSQYCWSAVPKYKIKSSEKINKPKKKKAKVLPDWLEHILISGWFCSPLVISRNMFGCQDWGGAGLRLMPPASSQ